MGGFNRPDDIILLFDDYSQDSQNLHASFEQAGCQCPAAVIEDDGFLPADVMSVYGFFLGSFQGVKGIPGRPRYFNQITVPKYWEISGNNRGGEIHHLYRVRGKIFYAKPGHRRLVKVVDWYDERGVVRSSDHYNRYGALYARTIFNAMVQKVNKTYFSGTGQEIIMENFVTRNIILNDGPKVRFFSSKTEFVRYFLEKTGFDQKRIFFNSLSTPFFVSQSLPATAMGKRDVLFWQEPVDNEIPGNMQIILKGGAGRTSKIMVQKQSSYDKLLKLGASPDIVGKLGFIYPFKKENSHMPKALICTNSDDIEHCRKLIEALPQMHFHIAALTEMSSKLMSIGSYENVSLYPAVQMNVLDELFETCDYYLDINKGSEIVSAVYQAFLHNHLIFAFQGTLHNQEYVAEESIYPSDAPDRMISHIRGAMEDETVMTAGLEKQRNRAFAETPGAYIRCLDTSF